MGIPISDEQFLRFFKNLFGGVRGFLARRLASKRGKRIAGAALATTLIAIAIAGRPQVSDVPLQGLVLQIEAQNILDEETGLSQCRVLIAVGDTVETQLLLPPPVPDIGHFVPLKKKGRAKYSLDLEKWTAEGPS